MIPARPLRILLAATLAICLLPAPALASDDPHGASNGVDCLGCHTGHESTGMALTVVEGNANLCLSCHQVAQTIIPAFVEGEQADLGARRGFHHRWDSGVSGHAEAVSLAAGSTGILRSGHAAGGYTGSGPKTYTVTVAADGGATSATLSWSATGSAGGSGAVACGVAVPLNEGITLTCLDQAGAPGPCGQAFCTGDAWEIAVSDVAALPTHPEVANRLFDGKVSCSTCHNQHSQQNPSHTTRTVGAETWQHFMRLPNDAGQLCMECHPDRFPDPSDPNHPYDLTRSWTGTFRSHPVQVGLGSNGRGYDRAEPLDADGNPQATGDGISSNDLHLTAGGQVSCLTCHAMHGAAADGNSQTE